MRRIGFSTGALARGDFRHALRLLHAHRVDVVELSALRIDELESLITAIPQLDLSGFSFVSLHAPSQYPAGKESWVVEQLARVKRFGFPIVVHPDVLYDTAEWSHFGADLLIENMDKRKPVGRSVRELRPIFDALPEARFCFDIGHARQVDPSMTEASLLLQAFGERLAEVHMSEVNTASRHDPITPWSVMAFQRVARYIPEEIPIVLEPLIDRGQSEIAMELASAREALQVAAFR